MGIVDLDKIRSQWGDVEELYNRFTSYCKKLTQDALQQHGIISRVENRAKDLRSLLKKVIREGYTSLDQVGDKAGVRIVAKYQSSLNEIDELIRNEFRVLNFEDKSALLAPDSFGYSGRHYNVQLVNADKGNVEFSGLQCEIQVHTRAQNLWSDTSHELLYKSLVELPPPMQRRIHRLVALVELFDQEVGSVVHAVEDADDFESGRLLLILESAFFQFVAIDYDVNLSRYIIGTIISAYSQDEVTDYSTIMNTFVEEHKSSLLTIFDSYAEDDRCSPLVFQPESLAIFERLVTKPHQLENVWSQKLQPELLAGITSVWGETV